MQPFTREMIMEIKHNLQWYKNALKAALEMEDFDEAKELRRVIKALQAKTKRV